MSIDDEGNIDEACPGRECPDHIISLIDGKPYKSLKRHFSKRDLFPEEYRVRYKAPSSYPVVAPAYSEQRR